MPLVPKLLPANAVRYDAYLQDGERLIRVLAVDGGTVWYEDCLRDVDADPPRKAMLSEICRSFRVVDREGG